MTEESGTKVSNRTRYLQRFGAVLLGAYIGGLGGLFWKINFGNESSSMRFAKVVLFIQEYTTELFSFWYEPYFWPPIILSVVIGMFAKRKRVGFVLALLVSGISSFAILSAMIGIIESIG